MEATQGKRGYVSIVLTDASKKALHDWSQKKIPMGELISMERDGKNEGGNVSHKAHITLFFGLIDSQINKMDLDSRLKQIHLEEIILSPTFIDTFPTSYSICKIVVLKLLDASNQFLNIRRMFFDFPNYPEDQKFNFTPHISLAFVKSDFDISNISLDDLPKLEIEKIEYKVKN